MTGTARLNAATGKINPFRESKRMAAGDALPRSHIPPLPSLLEKRHNLTAVEAPSVATSVSCQQQPPSPMSVTSSPRPCHVTPPPPSPVALVQDAGEESTMRAPAREESSIEEALVTDVIVCNFPERTLEGHTVKELQQMCAAQGLSTLGKKKVLCDRLRQRSTADGEN